MRRFLALSAPVFFVAMMAFSCVSCGPAQPTGPDHRVWQVHPSTLVRSYADQSARWTGQRVQIELPPKEYQPARNAIHWCIADGTHPAVIFDCPVTLADNNRPIRIVGICRGPVVDRLQRPGGITFYVQVTECSIATLP